MFLRGTSPIGSIGNVRVWETWDVELQSQPGLVLESGTPFTFAFSHTSYVRYQLRLFRAASSVGNPGSEVHQLLPFADSTMVHQCLACLAMAMIGSPEPGQTYLKLSRRSVRNLEKNFPCEQRCYLWSGFAVLWSRQGRVKSWCVCLRWGLFEVLMDVCILRGDGDICLWEGDDRVEAHIGSLSMMLQLEKRWKAIWGRKTLVRLDSL
jgi:hypothetical protein